MKVTFLRKREVRLTAVILSGLLSLTIIGYEIFDITQRYALPKLQWSTWILPTSISNFIINITAWFDNTNILIGNFYHLWIGIYIDNGILTIVKNNPQIFIPFCAILALIETFYLTKIYINEAKKTKDKAILLFIVIIGILTLFILSLYNISIIQGGAWERRLPFYWNWPLGITALLIIGLLIPFVGYENPSSSDYKFLLILSQISLIVFLCEGIYFLNDTTKINVEIRANQGWQNIGASVEKGQLVQINCTGLWSLDKNNTENYPFLSLNDYANDAQITTNTAASFPFQTEPPGPLVAKIGLDSLVYPIGDQSTFVSNSNGHIYLRMNDWDELLWNNTGTAQCNIEIFRPQLMGTFSIYQISNYVDHLIKPEKDTVASKTPLPTPSKLIQDKYIASPTKTETPVPTSINSFVPTKTLRPSWTPTPTIASPLILENYLFNPAIIQMNKFDNNNYFWDYSPSQVSLTNGVATIKGINSWANYIILKNTLKEGEGVLIDYLYEPSSNCEIFIANGDWYTENYKRFGIYPLFSSFISSQSPGTNYWSGKNSSLHPLGIRTNPNTWYTLFLGVDSGGKFLAIIWEKENPNNFIKYAQNPGEKWSGLDWTLDITADQGAISLSNFMKVKFSNFK